MAEQMLVRRELYGTWCLTRAAGRLCLRPVYDDPTGEPYVGDTQMLPDDDGPGSKEDWQAILEALLAAWTPPSKPEPES